MPNLLTSQVGGGTSGRYVGANFDVYGIGQSDAGREFILSISRRSYFNKRKIRRSNFVLDSWWIYIYKHRW